MHSPGSFNLAYRTSPEVAQYTQRRESTAIAILPLGATEQHGAHGALGTDSLAAEAVAARLAVKLDALVSPTIPFGHSATHRGYAGTISLSPQLLVSVLAEVTTGLLNQGFDLVLMLSGHRGNDAAMSLAASESRAALHSRGVVGHVLSMSYQDANRGRLADLVGPAGSISPVDSNYGADGHGGMVETSIALTMTPWAWRENLAVAPDRTLADANRSLSFHATLDIEELTEDGIFGNPVGANPTLGESVVEATADRIASDVRRYLELFG